jgi:putative ABC transport system permease protein
VTDSLSAVQEVSQAAPLATFSDIAIAAILVVLAVLISWLWKIPTQKEMSLGAVRAFVQLVLVGYALDFIFAIDSVWLIALAVLIMLVVGARQASLRIQKLGGSYWIVFIGMVTGSVVTLAILIATGLATSDDPAVPLARYVIPLAGMIVSNSMNAAALTVNRLVNGLTDGKLAVETALALGKTWRQASVKYQREAAVNGMLSMLNFLKTVGIVALPGGMTGMILAGASPLEAVLWQLIIGYMLLSSVTITALVAMELTVRKFFTVGHRFAPPFRI